MKFGKLFFIVFTALAVACTNVGKKTEGTVFKVHSFTVETDSLITSLSFPGKVIASEEFPLAFKLSGRIQSIYAEEGDFVKKGKLVAELDTKDYRDFLDLAQAKFNQVSAEAGRVMRLYSDSVVSSNDYDKARYGLEQARASLDLAKRQLEDCKLYSPVDGYVQKKFSQPSSIIGSGLAVMTIVSAGTPKVEIDIPASVLMQTKNICRCVAEFSGDQIPPLNLSILSQSPKANANQLYTVTLSIDPKANQIPRPGMIAMVHIDFDSPSDKFNDTKIPSGALFERNDSAFIWLISENDSTVHSVPVSIASLYSDGYVLLHNVLKPGTSIVTSGVHKLREGDRVSIMEKPSKTNVGGLL